MDLPSIAPDCLALPWSGPLPPYGTVRLDPASHGAAIVPPPFPLIGIGEPGHSLAPAMDIVVTTDGAAVPLVAAIVAQPRAAAVLVDLLRLVERVEPAAALSAESLAYGLLQGSAAHAGWLESRAIVPRSAPGQVRLDREADRLLVLIDRPEAHNAIDTAVRDGLRAAFELARLDRAIRAVRLTAKGRAFSTGADLAEFGTTRDPAEAHRIRAATLPAWPLLDMADRLEVHVQGACIGAGLEMAAFARRITAGRRAWFQLPELAMGLIPGAGGCVSVMRRIGRQRAALMILTGRRVDARTALGWGLIDAIVDD